jgi:hypothetical protein
MSNTIAGILHSEAETRKAVELLKENGFSPQTVSLLIPYKHLSKCLEQHTDSSDGICYSLDSFLSGILSWFGDWSTIAIPGLGAFVATGMLVPMLAEAADRKGAGVVTTLLSLGLNEHSARHYNDQLAAGHILSSVHVNSESEAKRAEDIFVAGGAGQVNRFCQTASSN